MQLNDSYDITVFGDSITKGIITTNEKLEVLPENAISLLDGYYKTKINNVSFYGQTLSRLYGKKTVDKYLEKLDNQKTNVAVLTLGGNDSDYKWDEVAKDPYGVHIPKTEVVDYEMMLEEIVTKLKENKVLVILTTLPPIHSQRYFENVISKYGDGKEIMKFLGGDITNIYRHQEIYNQAIMVIARKLNCPLIDVRSKFLSKMDFLDYLCNDGVHLNKKGHQLLFEIIVDFISKFELKAGE